jgi:hypothetical protein
MASRVADEPLTPREGERHSVTDQKNQTPLELSRAPFLTALRALRAAQDSDALRCAIVSLQEQIDGSSSALFDSDGGNPVTFDRDYLAAELAQIASSRTMARARYYIERLIKSATEVRTTRFSDINLNRWKAYDHVRTDSLWVIERRDNSGVHGAGYWGNFIPQIPHQMMLRYTHAREWVLDPFAGCGTTLIEGQRLGRNTIGVELQADVVVQTRQLVASEPNPHYVVAEIAMGDSRSFDFHAVLARHRQASVQLAILHPPYYDIIRFSQDPRDLSNAASVADFLEGLGVVVDNVQTVLDADRFLVLVIGDKYSQGEWIPLGFMAMNRVLCQGFRLKSIVVKNFDETAGKRSQKELWRYRALAGGFYLFKHEYIFIFQKR